MEELTSDIPNVSEEATRNLDETNHPLEPRELRYPYWKILQREKAILLRGRALRPSSEKSAGDVKDASLKASLRFTHSD